jgi:hypothetical protein
MLDVPSFRAENHDTELCMVAIFMERQAVSKRAT